MKKIIKNIRTQAPLKDMLISYLINLLSSGTFALLAYLFKRLVR